MRVVTLLVLLQIPWAFGLIPPRFQWKFIDFAWPNQKEKEAALANGDYVADHNMPTGLAKWRQKLFITVPRWKKGVPSSLNYIDTSGAQSQHLNPYPSWETAVVKDSAPRLSSNATVVSTFRVHVDDFDRLWVVDNGVCDMANGAKQVSPPAIIVFNLLDDTVLRRYDLPDEVLDSSTVFSSIVVDVVGRDRNDAFAYITDMGANAIIVYSLKENEAWKVQLKFLDSDESARVYKVGGIDYFWNDGVSSATLSRRKKNGHKDLFFHPTSSTKQFKISTEFLRGKNIDHNLLENSVEVVGDRGPKSQATACDFDPATNVLFFTQVSKNGFGCWNLDHPFTEKYTPLIFSDCTLMEFPNDIKVDAEGNVWVLSSRQSRFLYDKMDFREVNFRVLQAPVTQVIKGTPCGNYRKM